MQLDSPKFALLIVAAAFLGWLTRRTRFSGFVLLASGLAFFAAIPAAAPSNPGAYVPIGVFVLSTLITILGVRSLAALPVKDRGKQLWIPVVLLTILLTTVKFADSPWLASTPFHLALPLGVSYYVLRAISALVETSRGTLRDPKLSEVAGFLGFAPILSLGPIERASSFVNQWRAAITAREGLTLACQGIGRIIEGLFKFWILCKVLKLEATPFLDGSAPLDPAANPWSGLYAYSLYLYLNFSAASDLAIGAARFFGVKIAENFDMPYARANISEFWRAWHVSLSTWLRDFLFFPLGKRLPRAAAPILAPLLVMSLCGLWHGLTVPFLAWGFLHGAALAAHQLWVKARRANESLDKAADSFMGRAVGAVLTAHFVALTWVFFASPDIPRALTHLGALFTHLTSSGLTIAYGAAAVVLWSFVPDLREILRRKASSTEPTIGYHLATLWRSHVDLICLLILLARIYLGNAQPEGAFVYQGF